MPLHRVTTWHIPVTPPDTTDGCVPLLVSRACVACFQGAPDIAIASPSWYGGPGTRLLYNYGNGTFEAGVRQYAADTNSLALGDLDGDGVRLTSHRTRARRAPHVL